MWTLPVEDADFSMRWALIKAQFSRVIVAGEAVSDSRARRQERGIWQRRFYEQMIRDDRDFHAHADYIHWNPVKHGHVERVVDWPYSSFHAYVRNGWLPIDWAGESVARSTSSTS
jgi:putative transposase